MGSSISQVAIGVVCLGAAFVFGSYINNQPPLGNAAVLNPNEATKPQVDLGNLAQKGIEQMPQLKHRVASRASLEDLDRRSNLVPQDGLPSPSSLDPRMMAGQTGETPVAPAPDFSGVAASYEPSHVKSQPLANMPNVKPPANSSLKNLADSFPTKSAAPEPAIPDFTKEAEAVPIPKIAVDRNFSLEKPPAEVAPRKIDFKSPQPQNSIAEIAKSFKPSGESKEQARTQPSASIGSVEVANGETGFNTERPTWNQVEGDSAVTSQAEQPAITGERTASPAMTSVLESTPSLDEQPPMTTLDSDASQSWGDRVVARDRNVLPDADLAQIDPTQPKFRPIERSNETASVRRPAVPFKLTDNAKVKLVRLRKVATQNITLRTTEFKEHFVKPGETLQSISKLYFGKPDLYLDIYLANRGKLRNPVVVPAGTVLRIPMY